MKQETRLAHEFVEYFPDDLREGTLYISIPFATAAHKCACGCGQQVITPITPTDWQLNYDGETVTLYPSIGNWSFPCRSHYWIDRSRILWAGGMSREEIEAGRARDRRTKAEYFKEKAAGTPAKTEAGRKERIWQRFKRRFL